MALTRHYYTKFQPGCFYHVYNRSVDRKPMFKSEANYEFFLKQYDYLIEPLTYQLESMTIRKVFVLALAIAHGFHFLHDFIL